MTPEARARQLKGLADLLLLEKRARGASTPAEIAYLLANETQLLSRHRTALVWRTRGGAGRGRVVSVSGLPEPVREAPFTQWAERLCRRAEKRGAGDALALQRDDLPPDDAAAWDAYLPAHVLWLPLASPSGASHGGLLLARPEPWRDEERRVLAHWTQACAHALEALEHRGRLGPALRAGLRSRRALVAAGLLAVLALVLPVPLTVLAPAEVVPKDPLIVRSGLDGVVDEVLVDPNEPVHEGQALVRLDDAELQARHDVARQDLAIARAEYQRAQRAAVESREASARLPMLRARIDQKQAELRYVRSRLERVVVRAERDGIAVIPDPDELEGRPVRTGERLLTLASPRAVELEGWLPVGDNIPVPSDARVELFLNVRPERAIPARLDYIHYQAAVSPAGNLAYRLVSTFEKGGDLPRLGWRGTAKVHGPQVTLAYYLFRRPVAALREWTGW